MQRSILARLGHGEGKYAAFDGDNLTGAPRSEPPPEPAPRRALWRWLLLLALAAAAAIWTVRERWLHEFHWREFAASFANLQWHWVAAALVLALATYYGRALRWAVMLEPLRPRPDVWGIFKATAIGFTAVVLLGRPGEFIRPYLISIRERVPFSSQLAAWFLERICDLLAILLVFGIAAGRIGSSRASLGPAFGWVLETGGYAAAILGAICLAILVMMGRFSDSMRSRLVAALRVLPERHHGRMERAISAFVEGTASTAARGSMLRLCLYTAVEWLLIAASIACVFRAFEQTAAMTAHDVLIFMGFVAFGSVLQIPGVGGGVQIVSIFVLTQMYGVPLAVATSIAIMLWIITFVAIVPAGLLLAFHEGLNWKKLKDLEKRAVRAEAGIDET